MLWDLAEPRLEMPNAAAATVSSSLRKQRWLPLPSRLVAHTILDRLQKLPQPLQTWLHWLQPQLQGWWQTPRCSPTSTACAALQQSCLPPSLNCLLPLAQKSSASQREVCQQLRGGPFCWAQEARWRGRACLSFARDATCHDLEAMSDRDHIAIL